MSYLIYLFLPQVLQQDIILDTKMSSSPFDDVPFLCFKCQKTYATEEIFLMHECIRINEEAQASDPRAVLASQGGSEQKTEISDSTLKTIQSYHLSPRESPS